MWFNYKQSKEKEKEDVQGSTQIIGCLNYLSTMGKIDVGWKKPS
jgi:hypothetical protein